MIAYLDTSVILRVLFGQQPSWEGWAGWESAWSSELMGVEARRMIDRLRLESALDDEGVSQAHTLLTSIEEGVGVIQLTRAVLQRASSPMPTQVKTLDAVHLASAQLFAEHGQHCPIFVTHDYQQALAATALGFQVQGAPPR